MFTRKMDLGGSKMILQDLNQDPFTQNPILDGSEIDPFDLSKAKRSDWRNFRVTVAGLLSQDSRRSPSRTRDRRRWSGDACHDSGVSKLVRDNPSFDPVFMKI